MPCRLWLEVNPPGKFRGGLSYRRIVEVLLVGKLPDFRDIGVVDLDLVMDLVDGERRLGRYHEHRGDPGGTQAQFRIFTHPVHDPDRVTFKMQVRCKTTRDQLDSAQFRRRRVAAFLDPAPLRREGPSSEAVIKQCMIMIELPGGND